MSDPVAEAAAFLDAKVAGLNGNGNGTPASLAPVAWWPAEFIPTQIWWYNSVGGAKVACVCGERAFENTPYGSVSDKQFHAEGRPPHPQFGQFQRGYACSPTSLTIFLDGDYTDAWEQTATGKLLGPWRDVATVIRDCGNGKFKFHVVIIVPRELVHLWPKRLPTDFGHIISNGLCYIEGIHATGTKYEFTGNPCVIATEKLMRALLTDNGNVLHSANVIGNADDFDEDAETWKDPDGDYEEIFAENVLGNWVINKRNGSLPERCGIIKAAGENNVPGMRTLFSELCAEYDSATGRGDSDVHRAYSRCYPAYDKANSASSAAIFGTPKIPAAQQNGNSAATNSNKTVADLPPELIRPAGMEGASDEQLASLPVNSGAPAPSALNLPDSFWAALPVLTTIRQAAWSRGCPADAVLYAVLARTAAMCPPGLRADTGCGLATPILFAALCGPSSAGKSTSHRAARELLPELTFYPGLSSMPGGSSPGPFGSHFADGLPLGSGEGLAECYMTAEQVKITDASGKERIKLEKRKTKDHAFFYIDEGEALARMLDRSGATIGETLRRAWGGETLGQANASPDRWRIVPEGSYALGIVAGFQPATIGPLLADANAGTPQRFVYANATDPLIPDEPEKWPGPLKLEFSHGVAGLTGTAGSGYAGGPGGPGYTGQHWQHAIPFAAPVKAEIRARRLARSRGKEVAALLDGHADLTRAKLAALLAVLAGRAEVDAELWGLSGVMWRTSCTVRDALLSYGAAQRDQAEQHIRYTMAGRQAAVEDATDERAMARAYRSAARHVQRQKCKGGCKRRCVTNAIEGKVRALVSIDEVIERLITAEAIQPGAGETYLPGRYVTNAM